ncbi:SNF2 family N-terminal domain-containing protein [Mycena crocata]|nr:SNF2 family N-terminal domain-containing protein [Mycena crocata]
MQDPFSLENFLAYGTLHMNLVSDFQPQECLADLRGDGWHDFSAYNLEAKSAEDNTTIQNLRFLIKNQFISVVCSLLQEDSDPILILRIHLIPYDLPNVQGRLRNRKNDIVRTARNFLARLLPNISRSGNCWGEHALPDPPSPVEPVSLSEIYETISSPHCEDTTPVTRRLLDFSDDLGGLGLRSTLHRYQRESVAAMVEKEMDLRDNPDPLLLPVVGMDNQVFFMQPGTLEVLCERPRVAPCRGGILCEELGTGKTVMTLGLILATLHQLSAPEPAIFDERPVLTPLAFRHFPSSAFGKARVRFYGKKGKFDSRSRPRVPMLVELMLHKLVTSPVAHHPTSLQEAVLEHYAGPRKDNLPFYLHYPEPTDNERKTKRSGPDPGPPLLYLTSATLVVVPTNLILQWTQECSLHCEDSLRVCILRSTEAMPPAKILASEYDIVLMSYSRFTAEAKKGERLPWRECTCPEYANARVPKCVCKPPSSSPLTQIRWKRLVIDEGHVSASLSTVLTPFTKVLSVERRWIVTGTPTTNLLGLSLGKKVSETSASAFPNEAEDGDDPPSPVSSDLQGQEQDTDDHDAGVWTRADGEDVTKLGNMIAHFVGVPQLLKNPQLISTHIKDALLDRRGPRTGAIAVLTQVMESVMIRHQITDVEKEVILPPVTQELVLLDLEPLALKSYNAMQATIAINAIDSQRKDMDYMFHSRNAEHLQSTVQNMSQIMFWSVDDRLHNTAELLRETRIGELKSRVSPSNVEDAELLHNALEHLSLAANDPLWCTLQSHPDVPYRVYGLKKPVFEAWSRTTHPVEPTDSTVAGYVHPDRIRRLRNVVFNKPLLSEEALVQWGKEAAELDARQEAETVENLKRKKKSKSSRDDNKTRMKATEAAKKAVEPGTVKEVQKELQHIMRHLETMAPRSEAHRPPALVSKSQIAVTRLGSSASSKLNFIISEILKYSGTEKFLIFSDSELSLAHLGDALNLVEVDFLRYTTQTTSQVREQFVLTFETSEKYRVFLMELKHGARGLNLITASRVIFCEPVWRADVESQAIKRCHRIGQTRPITVKTLAIRGTAEETMAARRLALKDSREKLPKLIHERGMRAFIENPKFLAHPPTRLPRIDVPLVRSVAPGDEESGMREDTGVGEPMAVTPPPPRRIRFAGDNFSPTTVGSPKHIYSPNSPGDDATPRKRVRLQDHPPQNSNTRRVKFV